MCQDKLCSVDFNCSNRKDRSKQIFSLRARLCEFNANKKMYPLALFLYLMLTFGFSASFWLFIIYFLEFLFTILLKKFVIFSIFHFVLFVLSNFILVWRYQHMIYFEKTSIAWLVIWIFLHHFITEQTSIKTKKDDPFVQHLWKQNQLGGNRTDQADMLFDVFIPLFIIIGLLVINGFIVMIIWRQRKKR